MSTFDASKHPRDTRRGVTSSGRFVTAARPESGVSLAPSPKQWRADTVEQALGELRERDGGPRPRVDAKASAAAMRADLRTLFDHKFSVRMATGTAYGWVRVGWDDGPRERQVRPVVNGYCNMSFNGQTDSYDLVNTDSPVEYTLSGVNTSRGIGADGQRYIDGLFDAAGLDGYQRIDPQTGQRSTYDGGYEWSTPLPAGAVAQVEKALGAPLPGRITQYGALTAGQLANAIQASTDYTGDAPVTDFDLI